MLSLRKARMVRELRWRDRPIIMGVLNATPNSFFDGGEHATPREAIDHGRRLEEDGADIIDVGGESSRPFSSPVSTDMELKRVLPVVEGLRAKSDILLSIDTCKARVAREACRAGADIINDISGLRLDPEMASTARDLGAYVVVMHMKGTPKDMQEAPSYVDVVTEIREFFVERTRYATDSGIDEGKIIIDPGIGFGKRVEDNLKIMKFLKDLKALGKPLLIGTSMKDFIGTVTASPLKGRVEGTLASIAIAVWNGADILRVHNVKKAKKVVSLVDAIKKA